MCYVASIVQKWKTDHSISNSKFTMSFYAFVLNKIKYSIIAVIAKKRIRTLAPAV